MKKFFKTIGAFFKWCGTVLLSGLITLGVGILEIAFFPIWAIFIMKTPEESKTE